MIITNLMGGLGNQMFQYAFARALSLEHGHSLGWIEDMSIFYNHHGNPSLNEVFSIAGRSVQRSELRHIIGWRANPYIRYLFARNSFYGMWRSGGVIENDYECVTTSRLKRKDIYLHGYWQSERYFKKYEKIIRSDFSYRKEFRKEDFVVVDKMTSSTAVSVHVRRGDYLDKKNSTLFDVCGESYYLKAFELLADRFANLTFYIFSDNLSWVERNLISNRFNTVLVGHNFGKNSFGDMRLMSLADHHIIANSTFSWWGAWLNPSDNKIVISPASWFKKMKTPDELLPSEWLTL